MSLISHFFVASDSLGSKEKKLVEFCPLALVVYDIYGLFTSKITFKNVQKLFFFSIFLLIKNMIDN